MVISYGRSMNAITTIPPKACLTPLRLLLEESESLSKGRQRLRIFRAAWPVLRVAAPAAKATGNCRMGDSPRTGWQLQLASAMACRCHTLRMRARVPCPRGREPAGCAHTRWIPPMVCGASASFAIGRQPRALPILQLQYCHQRQASCPRGRLCLLSMAARCIYAYGQLHPDVGCTDASTGSGVCMGLMARIGADVTTLMHRPVSVSWLATRESRPHGIRRAHAHPDTPPTHTHTHTHTHRPPTEHRPTPTPPTRARSAAAARAAARRRRRCSNSSSTRGELPAAAAVGERPTVAGRPAMGCSSRVRTWAPGRSSGRPAACKELLVLLPPLRMWRRAVTASRGRRPPRPAAQSGAARPRRQTCPDPTPPPKCPAHALVSATAPVLLPAAGPCWDQPFDFDGKEIRLPNLVSACRSAAEREDKEKSQQHTAGWLWRLRGPIGVYTDVLEGREAAVGGKQTAHDLHPRARRQLESAGAFDGKELQLFTCAMWKAMVRKYLFSVT